jgi:hypothetical protein
MVDIEDLKIYFFDSFLSTEQIEESVTINGYNNWKIGEIVMSTGVGQNGSSHIFYDNKIFNPKYSELIFKLRMNSIENVKAFFGFRSNITEPEKTMTESHVGILIDSGKVYFTSASEDINNPGQQITEITGLDMTKVYEFKIAGDKLFIKPLPQVESYLGMPTIKRVEREFKLVMQNSTHGPDDQYHWITLFIKNTTNAEKLLYLNRIIYKEEYPD